MDQPTDPPAEPTNEASIAVAPWFVPKKTTPASVAWKSLAFLLLGLGGTCLVVGWVMSESWYFHDGLFSLGWLLFLAGLPLCWLGYHLWRD